MAEFKAFEPGIEVSGRSILAIIDGMGPGKSKGLKILEDNGISNLVPEKWYPQQAWLDSFRVIADKIGSATLKIIGTKISKNSKPLPEIDSIAKAFTMMDMMYHSSHRKNGKLMFDPMTGHMEEGIGHYYVEKIGDRSVKIVCRNPYPDDFEFGGIIGLARMYRPSDSLGLEVIHDDNADCRKKGDDSCTYMVSW